MKNPLCEAHMISPIIEQTVSFESANTTIFFARKVISSRYQIIVKVYQTATLSITTTVTRLRLELVMRNAMSR